MIYLTIITVAALITIGATSVALFVFIGREHRTEREQWVGERRELLNRIQRPDLPPSMPGQPHRRSAEDIAKDRERAREMASVGTVTHAD